MQSHPNGMMTREASCECVIPLGYLVKPFVTIILHSNLKYGYG